MGIAACLVVLAFGLTLRLLGLTTPVTRANVERIHEGMSRAEVEAILGGPGERDYTHPPTFLDPPTHAYRWSGAYGVAWVGFAFSSGPDEIVRWTEFEPTWRSNRRDPMRSLRAWLGR